MSSVECVRCGRCCMNVATPMDEGDAGRWELAGRDDLAERVRNARQLSIPPVFVEHGGELLEIRLSYRPCPFLTWDGTHNVCEIYEIRPERCRTFEPGLQPSCSQHGQ